ncbi:MAG: hypothetical protein RLY14_2023 [Planctomycetota bacterium]|jgi:uncharacterized coiled-coil DUF342 family protein
MSIEESKIQLLISMGLIKESDESRARQALEAFERLRQLNFNQSTPAEWSSKIGALAAAVQEEIESNQRFLSDIESLLQKVSILRNNSNEAFFYSIEDKSNVLRDWNKYLTDYIQKVKEAPGHSETKRLCSEIVNAIKRLKESVVTSVNR